MSKYIIDLRPDCKVVQQICASNENVSLGARSVELFDALTDDYVEENFKDLLEGEYQRGLDDAWEAAKKIANMWTRIGNNELLAIFGITERIGHSTIRALFEKQTANEAMLELEAYEEKQKQTDDEIKVGDIVERYLNGKLDSTGIYLGEDGDYWNCLFWTGAVFGTFAYPKNQFKKTEKHVDIASILEAMKHD